MPYNAKVVYPLGQDGPYTVSFPFLDEAHLIAEYDGYTEVPTYDPNTGTVTVLHSPPTISDIVIRRATPKTPVVDFEDRSTLTEENLDLTNLQWRYVTEELEDMFSDVVVGAGGMSIVAGNSSTGDTFPTGTIEEGHVHYKEDEGFKQYRWDGSQWVDVHKILEESDFGTGIEPVRIVTALPADDTDGKVVSYDGKLYTWDGSGWSNKINAAEIVGLLTGEQVSPGAIAADKLAAGLSAVKVVTTLPADNSEVSLVVLSTDGKLYRWDATLPGWTRAIPVADFDSQLTAGSIATDAITAAKISAGAIAAEHVSAGAIEADAIAADAIVAAKIAAGAVTADKIGANLVVTQKANIGDAVIESAHIDVIDAGLIETGYLRAQHLALASDIYDPDYDSRRFPAMSFNYMNSVTAHGFGSGDGFTFTHPTPITFYTQGSASGTPVLYRKSDGTILVSIDARIVGYTGLVTVYALKASNPGVYYPIASEDTANGKLVAFRQIYNIAINDTISFYCAPCDGNGDPTAGSLSHITQMDILAHNWR